MNPIIKDIFYNIKASKSGEKLKPIILTAQDIFYLFLEPGFLPEYKYLTENDCYFIFNNIHSMIPIDDITMWDAIEILNMELEDCEEKYEFDYDKHHGIRLSYDGWIDDVVGRYVADPEISKRYYDEDLDNDALVKEYGWERITTAKDDAKFNKEFLEWYGRLMKSKIEQFKRLQNEIADYEAAIADI